MTSKIYLKGVKAYGYVGYLPEENVLGQWFEVEATLWVDFEKATHNDEIEDTVNYISCIRKIEARHITPRREQKIKITMYVDADILDFFKERAKAPNASPYQTQINNELRAVIERKQTQITDEVVTLSMLDNPVFISALAEKLKAA